MAASQWLADFDEADALAKDVSYAIGERDQLRRSGAPASGDASLKPRAALTRLDRSVRDLTDELEEMEEDPAHFGITPAELNRRRDKLRALTATITRLKNQEKKAASSERDHLFAGGASPRYGRPASVPEGTSVQHQLQVQREEMKVQDEMLDGLSRGMDSLKTMGTAIGEEADLHMRLLDDMEAQTDTANRRLKTETSRAEHVSKTAATCWMYVIICLLILMLLGLLVGKLG